MVDSVLSEASDTDGIRGVANSVLLSIPLWALIRTALLWIAWRH